jgi:hypothetical protein
MVTVMCELKKVYTNIDCGPISKIFEIRNQTNYNIMDNGSSGGELLESSSSPKINWIRAIDKKKYYCSNGVEQ